MAQPDIDGALVGGASLDADDFAKIVQYRLGLIPFDHRADRCPRPPHRRVPRAHRPRAAAQRAGGGLSDMFGGGMGASAAGSTVVEKNLDRLTIVAGVMFTFTSVTLALMIDK